VENAAILEKITALKIDFAQGYFIAEPEALMPGEGAERAALRSA
jgi:EAL domain-containing protein (putative c-di-GMP-specific phosphodiesterase class I)